MTEPTQYKRKPSVAGRFLVRCAVVLTCLVALLVLAVVVYLASPLPARQLSQLGSSFLHQNLIVDRLQTTGGTIYLRGVRLDNPPGFPKGALVSAESVAIAPNWGDLLFGRQNFRLIHLDGIAVALEKNSQGIWNYTQLQKILAARKPSPAETRIADLKIGKGSILVNGLGLRGISLQVFNLATKGSRASDVDLAFEDGARNRFALKGTARAGAEPAVDLTLAAPSLALDRLASYLKLKDADLLQGGTGTLQLAARLHRKELSATGSLLFGNMRYATAGKSYPLAGKFEFTADYNLKSDAARLKSCQLAIDDLVQVHAAGSAQDLKRQPSYALDLDFSEIDLARLSALLPERTRRGMVAGGRVVGKALHLAGKGRELTGARGTLQLREGRLVREGRLLVEGLFGNIEVSRVSAGVLAQGRLAVTGGQGGRALVESLDLPFKFNLSRRMKPVGAEIPALSARVMGVSLSGRVGFQTAQANPLSASLKVPSTKLATLQPILTRYGITANSGTAALSVDATGRDAQNLAATVGVQLDGFRGLRAQNTLAAQRAVVNAKVHRAGGRLEVQGDAQLKGAAFDGQRADAGFSYRIADRMAYLDHAELNAAGTLISIAHLSAPLPTGKSPAKAAGTPLSLDFDGVALKGRDLQVDSVSGRVRATIRADAAGKWLDGTAEFASGGVAWQGKTLSAPSLKIAFAKAGSKAELGGKLLGGSLAGTVTGNPFALKAGTGFDLWLAGAHLAEAAPLLPKGSSAVPSDGLVDLHLAGSYARPGGLSCRLESKGAGVALAGAGGKTLLTGASFNLAGELAGENLTVGEGVLSLSTGVSLRLKGQLARPFSQERTGRLSFVLAETRADSLIDPLINLLPRVLQEAAIDGTVAADGRLDLVPGGKLVEGAVTFKGGRFELAQQKLLVSGINGKFPFSLDLSGQAAARPTTTLAFSKENFPRLLEQLRKQSGGQEVIKVDKIAFGPVELGTLTMQASAAKGMTEISSLRSSLYEGALLGRGFVTLQKGVNYRGDLLINGLSLKQLCSVFPGIQGYISGRVDGLLSVSGGARGLAGLSGFTELWAREGAGEKMLVSKEFLQRLAKQKLGGFFFRSDRSYDEAEIKALMEQGYLSFESLKIVHTNLFGVKDLNVTIAPTQNRIALDHLLESIKQAATRGKATTGAPVPETAPEAAPDATAPTQEFKWGE